MHPALRIAAVMLLLAAPLGAQTLPARQYLISGPLSDFATGDLNGDGRTDVVAVSWWNPEFSVLIRDPAGGFLPATIFDIDDKASSVAVGHLNADAYLDVVACSGNAGTLSVRLGNGAGGFGPLHVFSGLTYVSAFTLADFDGDGDDDVATVSMGTGAVTILLSDGTGELLPGGVVSMPDGPRAIDHADFDGNGTADLVVGNHFLSWSVLLGDGTGGFAPPLTMPMPASSYFVETGDVDEDGDADVVIQGSNGITLHPGNGDGSFAPLSLLALNGSMPELADANGDGFDDLITTSGDLKSVLVYLGHAGAAFDPPLPKISSGQEARKVAVIEADGDGLPDLVVGQSEPGGVIVLSGAGFGAFETFRFAPFDSDPSDQVVADLDGDNDLDVAIAALGYFGGGGVTILTNDGAGTLEPGPEMGPGYLWDIAAGDVDADGDLDLATTSGNGLGVRLNDGVGGYSAPVVFNTGPASFYVCLHDLDGDGDDDAVVARDFYANGAITVALATGGGGFAAPVDYPIGVTPVSPAVADLDLDGDPDIVTVASTLSDAVVVLLGDGAGGFSAPTVLPAVENPTAVAVGDVTGDGLPDLVIASQPPFLQDAVTVLPGDGSGGFLAAHPWPASFGLQAIAIADVDGDGLSDVLASTFLQGGGVILLRGDGSGFLPPEQHAAGEYPGHVAAADIDGDGRTDVLALNHHSDFETGAVTVLRNLGVPEPWTSLGKGLKGTAGIPMLVGHGSLEGGETVSLDLQGARPQSPAILVVGAWPLFAPFKGGVLVPRPNILVGGLATDATGSLALQGDWPVGLPSGAPTWYQFWIVDRLAVQGLAASNGLRSITP